MTPPEATGIGRNAGAPTPPAVSLCPKPGISQKQGICQKLEILRVRADFLRAAQARRQATPGFLLQARPRGDGSAAVRVGFTCSKKLGNAVARNRAKRRLREVARAVLRQGGQPGWDYVLVGRPQATAGREFAALLGDMEMALAKIHASKPKPETAGIEVGGTEVGGTEISGAKTRGANTSRANTSEDNAP
jgi:ribonuclease P protein component